jgi:glycosyltransferase involved in cell wall biosynthesis
MGNNAYEMAMEKYTWDVHVDKIVEKFNDVNK